MPVHNNTIQHVCFAKHTGILSEVKGIAQYYDHEFVIASLIVW